MEQRLSTVDVDSVLRSHGGDDDSNDDEEQFSPSRTVDEILLNYDASSSPPSVKGGGDGVDNDVLFSSRFLPVRRLVDSDKFNSTYGSSSNKSSGLPVLFGGGIGSSLKPGAALAAAVASSRTIPTPHATAIKMRRAGVSLSRRSTSEITENISSSDDLPLSPSDVASRISDSGLNDVAVLENSSIPGVEFHEVKEIMLERFPCENVDQASAHATEWHSSDYGPCKNSAELDEVPVHLRMPSRFEEDTRRVDKYEDIAMPSFHSHSSSLVDTAGEYVLNELDKNERESAAMPDEESEGPRRTNGASTNAKSVYKNFGGGSDFNIVDSADGENTVSQTDQSDVFEDAVNQQENNIQNTALQPQSHSSPKPLDMAEDIEKRQAFTGLHYEEGAAALPMRLEGLQSTSTVLGYFDVTSNNPVTRTLSSHSYLRDNGSPQVLAVHHNYIAVGMSKGSILVSPNKQTGHQVDSIDGKMMFFALQGDRSHVPVTSLCFNTQGDLLFSGYGDGHYTIWDVQKTSALKVIVEHRAPIVHLLHLSSDAQFTRQFKVLSGDSMGVVKLIHFSVSPWLNRISQTETTKLFDESTSRVVCVAPLLSDEVNLNMVPNQSTSDASAGTNSMMNDGAVIFVARQSALVAKVSPSVEVYTQLPKPEGVREGAMPYTAWKCTSQLADGLSESAENASVEISDKNSLIAIAWDRTIQVSKLVKFKVKVVEKWAIDSEVIGVAWLGNEMLAIVTVKAELYLFTQHGNLIHQTSISLEGFQGSDLISYHRYFTDALGNPEKAYHNNLAIRGSTMYLLGPENLIVCRLLSWKERIEVLQRAGDWEGALSTGMSIYDGKSHGIVDLPKNVDDLQRIIMPYLSELVHLYIREVFSYISMARYSQNSMMDQSDEITDQYIRAGGVAVEFCIHIKKTDILFDDIFSKFAEAQQKETFLELLEPYILKDMLGSIPPAIMQALVEHYSRRGWLQRIEQCILHMDILSLDFNQVIRLCREHGLHRALIYLFNKGLDDFRTPLEELLVLLQTSTREDAASLGYRVLVYLKYCFQGLVFPPGSGFVTPLRLPSLRKELLNFLLDGTSSHNSWADTSLPSHEYQENLLHLLELDTEATLEVLKCGFTDVQVSYATYSTQELNYFTEELAESQKLVQKVVDILCRLVEACKCQKGSPVSSNDIKSIEVWPSKKDMSDICDFIAYYVACERANICRDMLSLILEYLTEDVENWDAVSVKDTEVLQRKEKQLLLLLHVVPETHWDANYLLDLAAKSRFHQVCGYIHGKNHQYVAALDSYMKLTNAPIHAFSFIHDRLQQLHGKEFADFDVAVISRIDNLVRLSREGAYLLIAHHFMGKYQDILSKLQSQPESLFLYLKTVVEVCKSGTLDFSHLEKTEKFPSATAKGDQQISGGVQVYKDVIACSQKLLQNNQINLTDEMMQLYFELLCKYDRESVLQFLETSDNYSLEHCLHLCKEYAIVDAATFLLERVGDVGSAICLNLSNLGVKVVELEREIRKDYSAGVAVNITGVQKKKVVSEILDIMNICIGLCQRNSPRLKPEESESLWFQLLDAFFEPLVASDNTRATSTRVGANNSLDLSVNGLEDEEGRKLRNNSTRLRSNHIKRKLFTVFIKEIVEGMIGYVQLPRIMLKLLSVGDQEFGDVKLTVLGLLGTYDFERRILDTAKSLIEDDTYYIMSLLRKGASHGYSPRGFLCYICNSIFVKNSGIQIFNCGHAVHLDCVVEVDSASWCCPICLPKKKTHGSSSTRKMEDNELVSNRTSMSKQQALNTTSSLLSHDRESTENSYGLPQLSRFRLLHNLEKDQKLLEIENIPQLKLAPPALYHEKLKKGSDILSEENSGSSSLVEKPSRKSIFKGGSFVRFPLKSSSKFF